MKMTTLCYIEKDGKYLMLHRTKKKKDINKNKWIGVGGHAEAMEDPEECLLREVKEETGLDIQSPKLCGIKWWEAGHGRRYIILLFKTDRYTGTLHDSNEGKVFWAELDTLRSMRLAPSFDKMLDVFTNEDIQEYIQRKRTDGWTDILK